MDVLTPSMSVHYYVPGACRDQEEVIGCSGTGVTHGCDPLYGCGELNLGPLKE